MSAHVKLTILVDNKAGDGLTSEHGLSVLIELEGKRILFDTGQGAALADNIKTLRVDLTKTDVLVLSHGHYDHTGGIPLVLQHAGKLEVYCHPEFRKQRYSVKDGAATPIHIPEKSVSAMDRFPADRLHFVTQAVWLSERVGITGPIPRLTSYEDTGGPFYLDQEGTRPDPIEDDLALWIEVEDGVVVCAGCSHSGLVNTLDYVLRLSKGKKIRAVIGGFHLMNAGDDRLSRTVDALRSLAPELVAPCHCTGESATAALRNALGELVVAGASGKTYEFA